MATFKVEMEGDESLKRRLKSICVFGGSNLGKDIEFMRAATELGKVIGSKGFNLVYEGGIQGLRGCVAVSAVIRGSKVLSVILNSSCNNHPIVGTELRVSSLPERLGYMFSNADAFIALPGGLESLDGISSIIHWASLNFHKKPLGLLNINGFYDNLLSLLDQAVEQGFISHATRSTIMSASTVEELIYQLQIYAPEPDPLIKQPDWQLPSSSKKRKLDTTLGL